MLPRDFTAVNRKERMAINSLGLLLRPADERVMDFSEAVVWPDTEWAINEASRCIHCPDPAPCQKACPVDNDISYALWLIENSQFLEAASVYRRTSSLPDICGRICPQENLCEGACVRGKMNNLPVPTGALEAFVADYEREHQPYEILIGEPTGKDVAVVGAGPAGLSVAERLVEHGHDVTIFDSKVAPGGLLLYGIPNFKLPKNIVLEKWGTLANAGIKFVGKTYIGKGKSVDELFADGFDAVFLGVGVGIDAKLKNTPGTEIHGVYQSTDFLIYGNVNSKYLSDPRYEYLSVGKRVVVIGGGDTASDCLRTALRMSADEVTCLYRRTEKEMPGSEHDRKLAEEEGAKFRFLTQPVKFIATDDGKLKAVECIEMDLGELDSSGRRRPVPVEGSNFSVPADTAVLALGYWPDPVIGETTQDLETHNWGLIKIMDKETGATTREGVFAGGDCVTGPLLVATAMVSGRKAATAINRYLVGESLSEK